jgi:endonuclease YncB( thermonuclease family)
MFLLARHRSFPAPAGAALLGVAGLAAGLFAGASVLPVGASRGELSASGRLSAPPLHAGHPAQVLGVIDGDTFEARVRVWPGMDVTTKIRLRGIDAPEMHARCSSERAKALAARHALADMLNEGAVSVAGVTQDKFGGRVDAAVSTASTTDVAAALLQRGLVRAYDGKRRQSWCE